MSSSIITGEALKEEGMSRALNHTRSEWKLAFEKAVYLLEIGTEFTSEDITNKVGLPMSDSRGMNRAVGAMVNTMSKKGYIKKTGRQTRATRKTSHRRDLTVWVRVG